MSTTASATRNSARGGCWRSSSLLGGVPACPGHASAGLLAERPLRRVGVAPLLRHLFINLTDQDMEILLQALAADPVQEVIRRTAHFNWHGEMIRSILRQRGIQSVLLRALVR